MNTKKLFMLLAAVLLSSVSAFAQTDESQNNKNCRFKFTEGKLVSCQGNEGYVIYDMPEMTESELKSAVYTVLTSIFKSPKDAITNVSDNIIQVEGYSPSLFEERTSNDSRLSHHLIFSLVIQFKNGKIRYNTPSLKYLHFVLENPNLEETIEDKSDISNVNMRDYFEGDENIYEKLKKIENYFNNMLYSINSKLKQSNDW